MRFSNKKLWAAIFIVVLIFVEFQVDYVERCLGSVIEWTNGMRSQTGAVWERALAREAAAGKMGEIILREEEDRKLIESVSSFSELTGLFDRRETLVVSRDKFLFLYRKLPRYSANEIIPPLDLLRIIQDGVFRRAYLQKNDEGFSFLILNEMNDVVYSSSIEAGLFQTVSDLGPVISQVQRRFFNDSVITVGREQFMQAYNALETRNLKLQIVNDPFQLIQWGDDFLRVAVMPEDNTGIISLIFEVRSGVELSYIEYQARALAAYYLIQEINRFGEKRVNPVR